MRVIKNYLYNMSYQVLLIIVPLITMPYISRVLGPHGWGTYSYTNSIMSYFVLFANLAIDLYGSRQIAYVQRDVEEKSRIFFEIFLLKMSTTGISFIALFFYLLYDNHFRILMLAQSLTLLSTAVDVSWYFTGIEDFKKSVMRNVFVKLFSLILIFVFVKKSTDVLNYILIISGSTLIGNISLVPFLKNQIHRVSIKTINVMKHAKPAALIFIPQIGTQIYAVANKTLLGIFASMTAVGLFSSADSMVKLLMTMVSAISAVLLPRISDLLAQKDFEMVERFMKESFEVINCLAFPLMVGFAVVAHKFVPIFFGSGYDAVTGLIIIELPVVLFISWSVAITNQFLIPSEMTKQFLISTVVGAVTNIFFNVILIQQMGAYGTVLATLLSELMVVLYLLHSVKGRLHRKKVFFFDIGKFFTSSLLMGLVVFMFDSFLPNSIESIVIEVLLGIASYLLCLYVMKANIVINIKSFFSGAA